MAVYYKANVCELGWRGETGLVFDYGSSDRRRDRADGRNFHLCLALRGQSLELHYDLVERQREIDALTQKCLDGFAHVDGRVDDAIGATTIGADREHKDYGARPQDRSQEIEAREANRSRAHLELHVAGKLPFFACGHSQFAGEPDVAIEKTTHRVCHGFVLIVAFDQHGVIGGDTSDTCLASSLDELWHQGEHRGRVAARSRRFAGGEADFALGHCKPRHRIDEQQNLPALVAEILGDGRGGEGGLDAC